MSTQIDRRKITGFDQPDLAARALCTLKAGLCIVLPTDTVYGLAAQGDNQSGIARLQGIKGRGGDFPPPLMVADAGAAWPLVEVVSDQARRLAAAFWPGPLTLIMSCNQTWSLANTTGNLGIRVPKHTRLQALLRLTGPLAVSSANKHTLRAATTVEQAIEQLGDEVELYIDGGPTTGHIPSTVVDCSRPGLEILRLGQIPCDQILAAAGGLDA